jgi:hypothetical protein
MKQEICQARHPLHWSSVFLMPTNIPLLYRAYFAHGPNFILQQTHTTPPGSSRNSSQTPLLDRIPKASIIQASYLSLMPYAHHFHAHTAMAFLSWHRKTFRSIFTQSDSPHQLRVNTFIESSTKQYRAVCCVWKRWWNSRRFDEAGWCWK